MPKHAAAESCIGRLARAVRALTGERDVVRAWRAIGERTGGLWGSVLFDLSSSNRRSNDQTAEALRSMLAQCQVAAAESNLRCVCALFAPFWEDIPVEMTPVSYKTIEWQLVQESVFETAPDELHRLDDKDLLGDFLFLHLATSDRLRRWSAGPGRHGKPRQPPRGAGFVRERCWPPTRRASPQEFLRG